MYEGIAVKMKKLLCIFRFCDKDGYADQYIFKLLEELKIVTSRLVIVGNGEKI